MVVPIFNPTAQRDESYDAHWNALDMQYVHFEYMCHILIHVIKFHTEYLAGQLKAAFTIATLSC